MNIKRYEGSRVECMDWLENEILSWEVLQTRLLELSIISLVHLSCLISNFLGMFKICIAFNSRCYHEYEEYIMTSTKNNYLPRLVSSLVYALCSSQFHSIIIKCYSNSFSSRQVMLNTHLYFLSVFLAYPKRRSKII